MVVDLPSSSETFSNTNGKEESFCRATPIARKVHLQGCATWARPIQNPTLAMSHTYNITNGTEMWSGLAYVYTYIDA
jgi:hypothetical protein